MSDFWSRRKSAVEAERRAEAEAAKAARRAEREAAQEGKTDEELLEELGLPDPDSLTEGDDFRRFLAETVPARLKTRALRRLWQVNPVLANLDGLVDYGEDYTDAACVIENLQSAYQVGKGMRGHVEALARREAAGTETGAEAEPETEAAEAAEETVRAGDMPPAETAPEAAEGEGTASADTRERDAPVAEITPGRRRMAFVFEDQGTG